MKTGVKVSNQLLSSLGKLVKGVQTQANKFPKLASYGGTRQTTKIRCGREVIMQDKSSDERFAYDQQIIERERQMDDLSSHKTSILNLLEDLETENRKWLHRMQELNDLKLIRFRDTKANGRVQWQISVYQSAS